MPQSPSSTAPPRCAKNRPERRKVGDTLTATVVDRNGVDVSDNVTFQWYADDKAIEGADDETLVVDADLLGAALKVVVTAENGNTFESEETAEVKGEDKSLVFELVDDQGFQADGTARTTDTLRVSYGSDLGTPRHITWYNDGAVMAIYTLDANHLTQAAFNSDGCRSKVLDPATDLYTELAPGGWKVTIENTAGELWTSNTVDVVFEGSAIMTDVSVEDDYTTPSLTVDTDIADAILNVTFNKDYSGTLYMVESKYEKGYVGNAAILANATAVPAKLTTLLKKVNTPAGLTNKAATAAAAEALTAYQGVYYEDPDGAIHCKILVDLDDAAGDDTVTRGESYYLIWDQDDVDGDDPSVAGVKKEDLNTSETFTIPYLEAPASVKVTKFQNGTTTPEITMYNEDGEVLTWWSQAANAAVDTIDGLTGIKIYGVDSNAKSSSDTFKTIGNNSSVDKGVLKPVITALSKEYAYVTMKTEKGIFGADSITLESDVSESAKPALTKMALKEDGTNPEDAVVEFTGLSTKAPGTVYIIDGKSTAGGTYAQIVAKGVDEAIGKATVEGGASKVTVSNVFSAKAMAAAATFENKFVAVYVPDDQELWRSAAYGKDATTEFTLEPVITSFDKSEIEAKLTGETDPQAETTPGADDEAKAGIELTVTGIQLLDQFGNAWTGTADAAGVNAVAVSTSTLVAAHKESGSGVVTYDQDGKVTLVAILNSLDAAETYTGSYFDKGESFTYTVAGLKGLSVTIKTKHAIQTDAGTGINVDKNDTVPVTNTAFEVAIADNSTLANGGALGDAFSVS